VVDPTTWIFEKSGDGGDGEKARKPRLSTFSLVIACGLPLKVLARLDAACSRSNAGLVAIGGSGGSLAGFVWTGGFGNGGSGGSGSGESNGGGVGNGDVGGNGTVENVESAESFSSSLGEHRVVESRPDDSIRDLRLGCSPRLWPSGLLESAREALGKLEGMSDGEHSHVPAAVLVAAAVAAWGGSKNKNQTSSTTSSSSLPRPTASDRAEVASFLASMRRVSPETQSALDEENFDEAERLLRLALAPGARASSVPSRVADLLSDPQAINPASPPLPSASAPHSSVISMSSATAEGFWCLVSGLREFAVRKGKIDDDDDGDDDDSNGGGGEKAPSSSALSSPSLVLPLDGDLPDMTSSTEAFVALQRQYRAAAEAEAREVSGLASAAAARAATAEAAARARKAREDREEEREASAAAGAALPAAAPLPPPPSFSPASFEFDLADVKTFCKNARNLRVVRFPSFFASLQAPRRLVACAAKRALREGDPGAPPARAAAALLVLFAADRISSSAASFSSFAAPEEESEGEEAAAVAAAWAAAEEGDEASLCAVAAALKAGAAALLAEAESGGGESGGGGGVGGGGANAGDGGGGGAKGARAPSPSAAAAAAAALSGGAGQALDDAAAEGARAGVLAGANAGKEKNRFTGPGLHSVAAVLGGLAAQEAIKLVTRQFVPAPGVVVYDGATQAVTVLPLGGG